MENRRISLKGACVLIALLMVLLALTGYYVGSRWFWLKNISYYDYKTANLKKLLDEQPDSGAIRAEIAMTSYLKGDTKQSIKMLEGVLKEEAGNSKAALYLGIILSEQQNYSKAIDLLTGYLKDNQDFTTKIAYESLGKSYMGTGQYELALKYLKLAENRDPGNPEIYYNLGRTYEQLGKPQDAMFSYEKALQISGSYPDAEKALIELEEKMFQKNNY
jgi:tetratricopeptide (TPR) repeat protein